MIEGLLLADQSVHAPHTRREVGVLDIQLVVGGEVTLVALRAQIPGTRDFHRAQGRQDVSRTQLAIMRLVTAGARELALGTDRFVEAQEVAEGGSAGMMQSSAEGHLDRFQIRFAGLLAVGEDACQQRGYFARDLDLDRCGSFFSSGVNVSSTGRNAQIFSLISTTSPLSF